MDLSSESTSSLTVASVPVREDRVDLSIYNIKDIGVSAESLSVRTGWI